MKRKFFDPEGKEGDKQEPVGDLFVETLLGTVDCPAHPGNSLEKQVDEKNPRRTFAVCTCAIEGNQWRGKTVWETIEPDPDEPVTPIIPGGENG